MNDNTARLEKAITRAKKLDTRERELRAELKATRTQLYAAVAEALDEHGVPLARLARELGRERPAVYRWRDQARQASR